MIIKKSYIEKLIKEEIEAVFQENAVKQDIIHCFIDAIKHQNDARLFNDLKQIGIDNPLDALHIIDREEVDPDFYVNASHIHNAMVRTAGKGEEIMIDAFQDFPKVMSDPYKDPDPEFMRVPRTGHSRDALDIRKDRKNLTQG